MALAILDGVEGTVPTGSNTRGADKAAMVHKGNFYINAV